MFYNKEEKPKFNTSPSIKIINDSDIDNFKDTCFFLEAVDFLRSFDEAKVTNDLYNDSRSINDIMEDFEKENNAKIQNGSMGLLGAGINKFMQNLGNSFSKRFMVIYNRDVRWVKKHYDDIKNHKESVKLPKETYKYTIYDYIPCMKPIDKFVLDMKDATEIVCKSNLQNEKRLELEIATNMIKDEIQANDYYNEIRKEVLKDKRANVNNFGDCIFNRFRDGGETIGNTIYAKDLSKRLSDFSDYKKMIKDLESDFDFIDKTFKDLNKLALSLEVHVRENLRDEAVLKAYKDFMTTKNDQMYHVSSIYLLVLSGKLDAICCKYHDDISAFQIALHDDGKEVDYESIR